MRRQRNQFKDAFVAALSAVVLLLLCTLSASTAAAIITKETYSNGNMLATAKDEMIRTAPVSYALELIAAPVMPVHVHVCMFSLTRVPGHVSSRGGGLHEHRGTTSNCHPRFVTQVITTAQLMTVNALKLTYMIPELEVPGGAPAPPPMATMPQVEVTK